MALCIFLKAEFPSFPVFMIPWVTKPMRISSPSVFLVILFTFLPAPAWQWLPLETLFQLIESIQIGDAQ